MGWTTEGRMGEEIKNRERARKPNWSLMVLNLSLSWATRVLLPVWPCLLPMEANSSHLLSPSVWSATLDQGQPGPAHSGLCEKRYSAFLQNESAPDKAQGLDFRCRSSPPPKPCLDNCRTVQLPSSRPGPLAQPENPRSLEGYRSGAC